MLIKKALLKIQILQSENVVFLKEADRVDIKWGQISMVTATLNAMAEVLAHNKQYDYVWLISGQDFRSNPSMRSINF